MKDSIERHWVRFIGQRLPSMGLPAALKQHFKGGGFKLGERPEGPEALLVANSGSFEADEWMSVLKADIAKLGRELMEGSAGGRPSFAFPVKFVCKELQRVRAKPLCMVPQFSSVV